MMAGPHGWAVRKKKKATRGRFSFGLCLEAAGLLEELVAPGILSGRLDPAIGARLGLLLAGKIRTGVHNLLEHLIVHLAAG